MRQLTWSQGDIEISTDHTRIPTDKLNAAFASDHLPWAIGLPREVMQETLRNSLCFGVYQLSRGSETEPVTDTDTHHQKHSELIGFARCITDFSTFLYLTDVHIWPAHQGKGIGKWLVSCVQEVVDRMPYLRKAMALTSSWDRSVPFYDKLMGLKVVGGEPGVHGDNKPNLAVLSANGRGCVT